MDDRRDEIDDLEQRVGDWAAGLADTVIAGVKPLIEGIGVTFGSPGDRDELFRRVIGGRDDAIRRIRVNRDGMRHAARKLHEEDREAVRTFRRAARDARREESSSPNSLRGDLRAFVDEVSSAARQFPPDKETRRELQQLLLDTRHRIVDLLEAAAPKTDPASETPAEPATPSEAPEPAEPVESD